MCSLSSSPSIDQQQLTTKPSRTRRDAIGANTTTQHVGQRDKLRNSLGIPKSKELKNKASNQSLTTHLQLQAAGLPPTAFQVSNDVLSATHLVSSSDPLDKPLPTPPAVTEPSLAPPSEATPSPTLHTGVKAILGLFPANVSKPAIKTDLPAALDGSESTQQFVYSNRLICNGQSTISPAATVTGEQTTDKFANGPQEAGVIESEPSYGNDPQAWESDEAKREWIKKQDPYQHHHLRWLADKVVAESAKDYLIMPGFIAEVVILGPVLDSNIYRSLLDCFIQKFEEDKILDVALHGLDSGCFATTLKGTHKPSYQITVVVSRLLDVMVNSMIKNLSRIDDRQPLVAILMELKDTTDPILRFQVEYALRVLQYIPDDESTLQAVLRFGGEVAMAVLGVASVCKLEPREGLEASQKGRFEAMQSFLHGIRKGTKCEW
ncbi:hypothetical protein BGZ47_008605 [Haplosporangium gracile]|nr:hypothetical protein BGZ47_008605 [Haplosporangium gracile]